MGTFSQFRLNEFCNFLVSTKMIFILSMYLHYLPPAIDLIQSDIHIPDLTYFIDNDELSGGKSR